MVFQSLCLWKSFTIEPQQPGNHTQIERRNTMAKSATVKLKKYDLNEIPWTDVAACGEPYTKVAPVAAFSPGVVLPPHAPRRSTSPRPNHRCVVVIRSPRGSVRTPSPEQGSEASPPWECRRSPTPGAGRLRGRASPAPSLALRTCTSSRLESDAWPCQRRNAMNGRPLTAVAVLTTLALGTLVSSQALAPASVGAKTWVGHHSCGRAT